MASSIVLRLVAATRVVRPATLSRRWFSSDDAELTTFKDNRVVNGDTQPESSISTRRRDSFPTLLSVCGRWTASERRIRDGKGMGWDGMGRETEDWMHLRVDMPGLDKEQVKVSVEQNTLVIKGEGEKESEGEEYSRRYSSRIDLPANLYKIDEVKAEMKNGVLKVMVPKVKEDERKDVFQVHVA